MQEPVLIIGASGGIGSQIARHLVDVGRPVVLSARRERQLADLASELGPLAHVAPADCTCNDDIVALAKRIEERWGKLSGIVFGPATRFPSKLTVRTDWSSFAEQIDTQLKALHLVSREMLPLIAGGPATRRMIVLSTEYVLGAPPIKVAPYATAKAAITVYARIIAQEWLRHYVRVHILAPGMVRSDLTSDLPEEYLEQISRAMPERMLTTASDVADMVLFLMTDASDILYGEPIRVSRGKRQ